MDDLKSGLPQLRVCQVIHSLASGGAEELLVELARTGSQRGLDVSVLSLMPLGQHQVAADLRSAGARVESLDLGTRWDPRALRRGAQVMADLRPEVIHTHLKHADLVGAAAARKLGVPMVSTLHRIEDTGTRVERFKQWLGGQARMRMAARTITVSDAQRDWYLGAFGVDPQRVVTIRNGIADPGPPSDGEVERVRREMGVADGMLLVSMLGVMRPFKGHAQLIAAAELLPADLPVCIVLAGEGPLRADLERAAAATGREFRFPGWITDVGRLLAASDFIVHPTLTDALPTALIHSLAAGIPAVASDVGGVPEIVSEQSGILTPPDDPVALAAAISELALDRDRRVEMGRAARRRFDREFRAEVWVDSLRTLYCQMLTS